jgi:hypothetical protein
MRDRASQRTLVRSVRRSAPPSDQELSRRKVSTTAGAVGSRHGSNQQDLRVTTCGRALAEENPKHRSAFASRVRGSNPPSSDTQLYWPSAQVTLRFDIA